MDRKKIYYHIDCPAHGTDHSLVLMDAVSKECGMLVTLCPSFIAHDKTIYELFEISVVTPVEALEIVRKHHGRPPTR